MLCTVISRFTGLLGGKQKCTVYRGRVNTVFIVKSDYQGRYIEGHGKSGPGKSGGYCTKDLKSRIAAFSPFYCLIREYLYIKLIKL